MLPTRRFVCSALGASLFSLKVRAQENTPLILEAAPIARLFKPENKEAVTFWAFNGQIPGPVLRFRKNQEVHLQIKNTLPQPLSFHWQGMRVPNAFDGVAPLTQKPIAPGETGIIRFTPPDSGTFLLRPLMPGLAAEAMERGLYALVIVEEEKPPVIDHELALIVDDLKLEESGALSNFTPGVERAALGRLGNVLGINGAAAPFTFEARPGARLRIRLVSAANARAFRIRFDELRPFVAAVDSQPTDKFEPLRSSLPVSPGTRYDLLIDLPREENKTGSVTALLGQGLPLITFTTNGEALPERPPLAASESLAENPKLPAIIRLQDSLRRDLLIEGGARRSESGDLTFTGDTTKIWTINKEPGSFTKPLFSIKRGKPVVLSFANDTPFPQGFHLHGHAFRLLHGMDDGWEPYWLDTFQVPEGRTSRIAFIADNPGKWLIGSSVLERLDAGLWTWFEVN